MNTGQALVVIAAVVAAIVLALLGLVLAVLYRNGQADRAVDDDEIRDYWAQVRTEERHNQLRAGRSVP